MKKKCFSIFILFISLSLFLSFHREGKHTSSEIIGSERAVSTPQSVKKPDYDYMSSILSRNTKPLGLKENLPLRKFLNQPSFKWALRAGGRHILN